MTSFSVVIPARFASTRLPGKPLEDIGGRPMIGHVWERAMEAGATRVVIATDDVRVQDACRMFGADALMTSVSHVSGTDRIDEVRRLLGLPDGEIIVNVQGDEPLMPPENIRQVAALAAIPETDIATLHVPVVSLQEYTDPNVVKLVVDGNGRAMYFSRAPIPWCRDGQRVEGGMPATFTGAMRHLGIYAYRAGALRRFAATPACVLEETEKLEQLRALWLGMTIRTAVALRTPMRGIDTPEDLEAVRQFLRER